MKKLKTLISTILVGALSSAIYEFLLKDLFVQILSWISQISLRFANDAFYAQLPNGLDAISIQIYSFITCFFALMIAVPPKFLKNLFHQYPRNKYYALLHNAFRICCIIILFGNMMLDTSVYQTASDIIHKIEIVSPYITDIEYKSLKSKFYLIDSKQDYEYIVQHLEQLMIDNDLKIQ